MSIIYVALTAAVITVVFLITYRRRGTAFAVGASLLTFLALGAAYIALVWLIVRNMS